MTAAVRAASASAYTANRRNMNTTRLSSLLNSQFKTPHWQSVTQIYSQSISLSPVWKLASHSAVLKSVTQPSTGEESANPSAVHSHCQICHNRNFRATQQECNFFPSVEHANPGLGIMDWICQSVRWNEGGRRNTKRCKSSFGFDVKETDVGVWTHMKTTKVEELQSERVQNPVRKHVQMSKKGMSARRENMMVSESKHRQNQNKKKITCSGSDALWILEMTGNNTKTWHDNACFRPALQHKNIQPKSFKRNSEAQTAAQWFNTNWWLKTLTALLSMSLSVVNLMLFGSFQSWMCCLRRMFFHPYPKCRSFYFMSDKHIYPLHLLFLCFCAFILKNVTSLCF